jgi:hypothetical protein
MTTTGLKDLSKFRLLNAVYDSYRGSVNLLETVVVIDKAKQLV